MQNNAALVVRGGGGGGRAMSAEVTTQARTHAPECRRRGALPFLFLPLLHRHPHTHFYFCCLTFFNMKVHSLIHASGIVVFFPLFACAVYRYFGYQLLYFLTIKLEWVVYFFRGAPTGARGAGGCSQLENYSLPTHAERAFRYFCLL